MNHPTSDTLNRPTTRLGFESWITELLSRVNSLPTGCIDSVVGGFLRDICERFEVDRAVLWQSLENDVDAMRLTHWHQRCENPAPAAADGDLFSWGDAESQRRRALQQVAETEVQKALPWLHRRICSGAAHVIAALTDLPVEAEQDRATLERHGIGSAAIVPLCVGGEWLGIVMFANLQPGRDWSEETVRRLEIVGNLLAYGIARQRADHAFNENLERLNLVTHATGAGPWVFYVDTGKVWATAKINEMFGFTAADQLTYANFSQRIHPDDRERVRNAVQQTIQNGSVLSIEYRVVLPDGSVRWIFSNARRHSSARPLRLTGISLDVTDRKKSEEQKQKIIGEWQATFDAIQHPILLIDSDCRVVRANAATNSLVGSDGIVGNPCFNLLGSHCTHAVNCPMRSALYSRKREEAEFYDQHRQSWIREIATPLLNESGTLNGIILSIEEITVQKRLEEKIASYEAEIERLKERLPAEIECVEVEGRTTQTFGRISGRSEVIKKVLHQVNQVAPTDATVLVCGETGTGKELFAEAIHSLSARKDRPIIKVNCAALPPPLVESELFGREKGAYTGALARQEGRFEVANNSSLFLDEIGELSLEAQAKLLRVLQEGQFERLGSPKTISVNVRLIAATNRNLVDEVRKGRFREDLYYRLSVFPIKVPPLRERAEDIPLLVWTFVEEFSTRMGRKITRIPRKTMEALQGYVWPGNVRELRNVIERSVIISSGDTLRVAQLQEIEQSRQPLTLQETEREHILRTLEKTFWHIKGPNGAAGKLGLKPSTLYTRMQKLGIPNRRQKDAIQT